MSDLHTLALRKADQARTDFAAIESEVAVIQIQISRLPSRAYVCRMLLLMMASIWALLIGLALFLTR